MAAFDGEPVWTMAPSLKSVVMAESWSPEPIEDGFVLARPGIGALDGVSCSVRTSENWAVVCL